MDCSLAGAQKYACHVRFGSTVTSSKRIRVMPIETHPRLWRSHSLPLFLEIVSRYIIGMFLIGRQDEEKSPQWYVTRLD